MLSFGLGFQHSIDSTEVCVCVCMCVCVRACVHVRAAGLLASIFEGVGILHARSTVVDDIAGVIVGDLGSVMALSSLLNLGRTTV